MKLLYITNGINGSGGLERVLSVKASMLAEEYNYQVTILSLNDAHLNPFYIFSPKIKMISIPVGGNPISYLLNYKKGLQQIVDEIQPDIISVCDDGLKAFFIPNLIKTNAKLIYERHVSKLIEAKQGQSFQKKTLTKIKWILMDKLGQRFSRFILLTNGNEKEWSNLSNTQVIPNPLPFQSDSISNQENKIVICVGKISYQKGQDLLAKAWQKVHQQFPEWQLHWYGKENLKFYNTDNLESNIHYFPPEQNIQQKYLDASIYVMSSRFEGFGMVLIEAMECGLPCVSFDCDYGPADIINHKVDGFLVAKENTEGLAEKLIHLIQNKELRIQMGRKAKESVKKYAADEVVQQWDELFKELTQ